MKTFFVVAAFCILFFNAGVSRADIISANPYDLSYIQTTKVDNGVLFELCTRNIKPGVTNDHCVKLGTLNSEKIKIIRAVVKNSALSAVSPSIAVAAYVIEKISDKNIHSISKAANMMIFGPGLGLAVTYGGKAMFEYLLKWFNPKNLSEQLKEVAKYVKFNKKDIVIDDDIKKFAEDQLKKILQ